MPRPSPLVAFDFSSLDHLTPGNGQYRYCTDLLTGLARVPSDFRFLVIGSRPAPPAQIAHLFDQSRWRYTHVPRLTARGAYFIDHARFGWLLARERAGLFHSPHTFLPRSPARTVVTVLDLMTEVFPEYQDRLASRPYRRFKTSVQRDGTHVIAISRTTAADLQRFWQVPAERISTVYIGGDPVRPASAPRQDLQRLARQAFVLSPYNLEPRKNLRALLQAVAGVRRASPEVTLVLYGHAAVTQERERHFQHDLRELGIAGAVTLTGFVSDEDLAWLYRAATLFVFPSLYEGFGIPVLEAMRAGTCVIARNQSAMAEILGDAGVQVDTSDTGALTAAVRDLLSSPGRRAALGGAGQARAAQFSQEAMTRGTLAAYMVALER